MIVLNFAIDGQGSGRGQQIDSEFKPNLTLNIIISEQRQKIRKTKNLKIKKIKILLFFFKISINWDFV